MPSSIVCWFANRNFRQSYLCVYTGCIEKFEFEEEDNKELINSSGLYKQIDNLGIYDSLDSIKKDLSLMYELDKYEIVNIGKISNE